MDVGAPSNFERLQKLFPEQLLAGSDTDAYSVSDADIQAVVAAAPARYGQIVCPHTACGVRALELKRAGGDAQHWLIAGTAHPAKFDSIVEPLIGQSVPLPAAFAQLLAQPSFAEPLANDYAALRRVLTAPN
jgi:threonine synthase